MVNILGSRRISDGEISSNTEIITTEKISERGIRDITELLQEMEAVNVVTSSWGKQQISIRGSNANEVSVYLDGIKINRAIDGIADLAFIDLSDLATVEVIRGGNSLLFGPGNFGGVVLLHSSKPDNNSLQINRSFGLTDDSDQDIGGALTFFTGSLAGGGRFSEKSRLYDGRTLHTAIYQNGVLDFNTPFVRMIARKMEVSNSITFPSGSILSSDKMIVDRAYFSGYMPYFGDWYTQIGQRKWMWKDNFFSNLERDLDDNSNSFRIGKSLLWQNLSGKFQWEVESKTYNAIQNIEDIYSDQKLVDKGELIHYDNGWAGIIRYEVQPEIKEIETIRWELGLRNSSSHYEHQQVVEIYNDTLLNNQTDYDINYNFSLSTFRLGSFISGRLGKSFFEIFFNQGVNHRPPTLNDQLLWHTSKTWLNQTNVMNIEPDLKKEYVTTTELSANLYSDVRTERAINNWGIGIGVFRNYYLDKIYYQALTENIFEPVNRNQAWMNGMEFRFKGAILNKSLDFGSNLTILYPSEDIIFPNKPKFQGNINIDMLWKSFRLNLSHIYQGRQNYLIHGIVIQNIASRKSTNVTLSVHQHIWMFDITASYFIKNLFSDKVTIVNTAHPDYENFNYYDNHRKLISIKIILGDKTKNK
tara:strand:- start:1235 stop:3163 length:1929 start_codon:yes stop_codon:yes gene_type:complete